MFDRPEGTPVDPLSDALALVKSRCVFSAVFKAGGDWSVRFSKIPKGIKFGVVLQGRCWLALDGRTPIELRVGDCYLLTTSCPYELSSDLQLAPFAFDGTLRFGSEIETMIAGGRFEFEGPGASLLIDLLPNMLYADATSNAATTLPWVLEKLRMEFASGGPGSALMSEQLASIVFIEMLRVYLASTSGDEGWLRALNDETIGEALLRVHREPARRWTVKELALEVGQSRSVFAGRFRALVGVAPLEYIMRWRMQLAEYALLSQDTTVAIVAHALGYESESAFSNAFKRFTGLAPSHYRNEHFAKVTEG